MQSKFIIIKSNFMRLLIHQ